MTKPLKETTLKKFIKEKTGLRVESAAIETLAARMNDKIQRIVDRAAVLVEIQEKSTLQLRDIEQAIEELDTEEEIDTPEAVFEVIESFEITELGDLARQLEKSLEG